MINIFGGFQDKMSAGIIDTGMIFDDLMKLLQML